MLRRFFQRSLIIAFGTLLAVPVYLSFLPGTAHAAATLYVSAPGSVKVGDTVTITVVVSTGGQSANAFQADFSYPASLFDGVRGTFSGSVCTLPVTQPDPSGGTASFSCGTPSGFNGTGTVATIVLSAKAAGSASFGLSNCQVLANDGQGTDITGGCSGSSTSVTQPVVATPTPTPPPPASTPTPAPTANTSTSTKATATPRTQSTATPKAAETPKATPTPTPEPTPPPAQPLSSSAPEAAAAASAQPTANSTPSNSSTSNTASTSQKRTISQAFTDLFGSLKDIGSIGKSVSGIVALMVALIPVLGLSCAILFMVYRLYILERRRRRTLDRLFEMELSELAALEGKLDLLSEKGTKGKELYREEFKKVKENILRQLRPDFGRPVDTSNNKLEKLAEKAENKIAPEKK